MAGLEVFVVYGTALILTMTGRWYWSPRHRASAAGPYRTSLQRLLEGLAITIFARLVWQPWLAGTGTPPAALSDAMWAIGRLAHMIVPLLFLLSLVWFAVREVWRRGLETEVVAPGASLASEGNGDTGRAAPSFGLLVTRWEPSPRFDGQRMQDLRLILFSGAFSLWAVLMQWWGGPFRSFTVPIRMATPWAYQGFVLDGVLLLVVLSGLMRIATALMDMLTLWMYPHLARILDATSRRWGHRGDGSRRSETGCPV